MLRSIAKYSFSFLMAPFIKDARKTIGADVFSNLNQHDYNDLDKEEAIDLAADWLIHSQKNMADAGFGSYHLFKGWTSSYPETSGYIIDTLLKYARIRDNQEIVKKCIECADWLLKIQKKSGGWQSMTIDHNKPEVVFNTGQVIRGVYAVYLETNNEKYLTACNRALEWLCDIQDHDGAWRKHAFMNVERVYDSYVDAPILLVNKRLNNEVYRKKAMDNLNWIINNKQLTNGWFSDCDNTIHKNRKPILHTISYTIDGLVDSASYTGDKRFFIAGRKAAEKLLDMFLTSGKLYGRYDADWKGSEHPILTGCAQISICWMKIYIETKEERFLTGAVKMNNFLLSAQRRTMNGTKRTKGALTGSYPVWGRYESFACPNWATKYFIDAIMLELSITKSRS